MIQSVSRTPARATPPDGTRLGRVAMAAAGLAVGLMVLTALLGPSAAVPSLPRGSFPPFAPGTSLHPSPWLVTAMLALAVLAGLGATAAAWAALRRGWAPSPRRLLAVGLLAVGLLAVIPPLAGADVLSYAAYGRIETLGLDPYTVRPNTLSGDPFARAVEDPWRATPSIYGPLATAEQARLVRLAGGHLRLAVGLLDLVNGIGFAAAAFLLYFLAGPGADRRRRAVLAFGLNPVLLMVTVGGGHLDALVALTLVAALALWRRSPWWSGIAGGAAILVKLTAGLPLLGWAWIVRRSQSRAVRFVAGTLAAVAAGYATVGLHALAQARRASGFVSVGTPWRPIRAVLQALAGHHVASLAVSAGAAAVTIWLATTFARSLPPADASEDTVAAARAGLVLALAWTLAAPYVLGWYDAVPWALLALVPASRYDRILLAHTGMLALAYLPGRVVPLPPVLTGATTVLRSGVSPAVLGALVVAALLLDRLPTTAHPSRLPRPRRVAT